MKTYIFKVDIEQEEDGRWSADIPSLPGCAAWGYTREEALEAIQDGAQAYLEVIIEHDDPLPPETEEWVKMPSDSDVVTVTLRGTPGD